MKLLPLGAALLLAWLPSGSLGVVVYTINGGSAQPLVNNTINVGFLTGVDPTRVHVFDDFGVDESIVGQLVVQGSTDPFGGSSLLLQIVDGSVTDAFSEPPSIFRPPGLRNLGGIRFENPADPLDTSLRGWSVVAVAVRGDITGDIDCGQVFRIDAQASADGTFGGTISGNITTHTSNGFVVPSSTSVGFVRAGRGIAGTISAPADFYHGGFADIARVVVGPATGGTGIDGDILAPFGNIGSVLTTGPIGTTSRRSQIRAGYGIFEIRAVSEASPAQVLAVPFRADVASGAAYTFLFLSDPPCPGAGTVVPELDGALRLIETAGDFTGDIHAANLARYYGVCSELDGTRHSGILVGGALTGSVTIDLNIENADIIASSITGSVKVGVKAKGAIVATDQANGLIGSVDIGNAGITYASPVPLGTLSTYVLHFPRGFVGNDCPPFDAHTPGQWLDAAYHAGRANLCLPVNRPYDGGSVDSVIRASRIGHVAIRSLTLTYTGIPPGPSLQKRFAPRIEATIVGDSDPANDPDLHIDDMREGVVWSGLLEYDANGQVNNDPRNDYAIAAMASVGCVGPAADLWLTSPVTGSMAVDVDGSVLGEVHAPTLFPRDVIRLGHSLQSYTDGCQCTVCGTYYSGNPLNESSPRDPTPGGQFPARGAIRVADVRGLKGQVIINAGAQTADAWQGDVVVPESGTVTATLAPNSAQPYQAPYYERPSAPLGGGAVGVVPFQFYEEDLPPYVPTSLLTPAEMDINDFMGDVIGEPYGKPVRMPFYGPLVAAPDGTTPNPLNLEIWNPTQNVFVPIAGVMSARVGAQAAPSKREVRLVRREAGFPARRVPPPAGIYRVTRGTLACDLAPEPPLNPPQPLVAPFTYYFVLGEDCDHDGHIDPRRCTSPPGGTNCVADCDDGSGTGTPDGGVTIDDLIYFLTKFDAGSLDADVTADATNCDAGGDGGVTIDDLLCFLTHFDAGC